MMRTIDGTLSRARIKAAELGTSLSALVRALLNRLAAEPHNNPVPELEAEVMQERRQRLIDEAIAEITAKGGACG